ncbi:hypothetical protein AVEN_235557-1 [Araneus ventricosus]|uniref:Tc1-like transposase DDE domain-containing protein n=1 Tax=Araneus ventricosus TaxID=182803 RepID=A0A4Y2IW11_ARAVE|nr:hypothetical protein AVEN_235557-1 [Araneus ventricosus]
MPKNLTLTTRLQVLFLDDIARPHTTRDTKEHICRLEWERLDRSVYSPDLAPSDFLLFPALKSVLWECHFRSNEEVKNFLSSLGIYSLRIYYCRMHLMKNIVALSLNAWETWEPSGKVSDPGALPGSKPDSTEDPSCIGPVALIISYVGGPNVLPLLWCP